MDKNNHFLAFLSPKVKRGVPLKSMLLKMLFGNFSSAFNLSFNKSFIFSCESMKSDFDIIKIFSSIFAINDFDMIHLINKKNKKEINNIYVNRYISQYSKY